MCSCPIYVLLKKFINSLIIIIAESFIYNVSGIYNILLICEAHNITKINLCDYVCSMEGQQMSFVFKVYIYWLKHL